MSFFIFFIKNNPIYFNISHSENVLAIAISDNIVGIDIEYQNPNFQFENVLDYVLSKSEKLTIRDLPKERQLSQFFQYWTQKESALKAVGVGLNFDLTQIEIKHNKMLFNNKDVINIEPFYVIDDDYKGYLSCFKEDMIVKYMDVSEVLQTVPDF